MEHFHSQLRKGDISAASIAIIVLILRTPGILGITAESFAQGPFTAEQVQVFTTIATYTLPIVLVIILIVQGVELAKAVFGLIRVNYKTK